MAPDNPFVDHVGSSRAVAASSDHGSGARRLISRSAEGVGKSTTLSVVTSFILIILFDCILTGIFYFMNK